MDWKTSSFRSSAQGNCVEVGFAKSSYCNNGTCVEVGVAKTSSHSLNSDCVETEGAIDGDVLVRDSKDKTGNGETLNFSPEQWEEILDEIRANEFNWETFRPLIFDNGERHAFVLGVRAGEFELEKETV